MKFRYLFISLLGLLSLVGCSDTASTSQKTTYQEEKTEIDTSSFSENKKKFVDAMSSSGDLSVEICVCMYDSMNPKLSERFGENWMNQGMQDLDLWADELDKAMSKCGLVYKS